MRLKVEFNLIEKDNKSFSECINLNI
jgi:hypothetical protein